MVFSDLIGLQYTQRGPKFLSMQSILTRNLLVIKPVSIPVAGRSGGRIWFESWGGGAAEEVPS